MTPSPPQEAEQFRGKTLTPESPKPVHYPSPSNVPLLVDQMDPNFHESAMGGPPSYSPLPPQNHDAHPYYAQAQLAPVYHNAQVGGAAANGHDEYARTLGYASGPAPVAQDTAAIHKFAHQQHAAAAPYSDAASIPQHENRPAYHISYDTAARSPCPGADPQAYPAQGYNKVEHPGERLGGGGGSGGGVDFQAILDNLAIPIQNSSSHDGNAAASMPSQASQTHGNALTSSSVLPPAPNLPPRPPPQAKPATHPNYAPEDDIRSYHPHSRKAPNASYRTQPGLQPLMTANASVNGLPSSTYSQQPPNSATRSNQSPETPNFRQRDSVDRRQDADPLDDEDARWPPEINKMYEEFLEDERKFVTDGQWDQFPMGSRLFIGNLPTEKVTKRDIFHRFYRHGRLAQISIKQAYGFVQFLEKDSCQRALQAEQGQVIRGRKMHLEISKPQRNTRKAEDGGNNARGAGGRRRSRSPDYTRGGTNSQSGRGVDRYTSQPNGSSPRDRDFRRNRDDYRPGRSPSPRGGGRSGRGRDRSRDRYDGRMRSRSRSPGFVRGRYRSPSPRRDLGDDLPLPRRALHEVPDVQVIVVDDLDRAFIEWIDGCFHRASLRCDVIVISARLSEPAVVRRQILEGVLAVSRLTRKSMETSKIPLTIFDRRGGTDNVRYEEYVDIEPNMAAQVVVNAKRTHFQPIAPPPPPPTQYGIPPAGYGIPQPPALSQPTSYQPPNQGPPPITNANLSNLISSLDTNGLQKLLGAMQQPNPQQPQPPQPGLTPDLARLLNASAVPPHQGYGPPAQAEMQPRPPQGQGQPDMNEIMAQLAKYRR